MKILVTGTTGFVDSVLMPELIKRYGPEPLSAFVLAGDEIPGTGSGARTRAIRVRTNASPHTIVDAPPPSMFNVLK